MTAEARSSSTVAAMLETPLGQILEMDGILAAVAFSGAGGVLASMFAPGETADPAAVVTEVARRFDRPPLERTLSLLIEGESRIFFLLRHADTGNGIIVVGRKGQNLGLAKLKMKEVLDRLGGPR